VDLPQPVAPLDVMIVESSSISCFGAADGVLTTTVSGPFSSLNYSWNNGTTSSINSNLDVGSIDVVVTNENGCEATATYLLEQPTEVTATTFVTDINCLDGPGMGIITVEDVQGGTPGYTYSIDGQNFSDLPLFENLFADAYDIVVRDAAGCELVLPSTVSPPPPISVELFSPQVKEENDNTVRLGDPVQLEAITGSNNAVFTWSHADSLQQQNITVRPMETQIYQVVVLDTVTFCTAEDLLRVFVDTKPRVFIPNVFSPNDDGNNDTFLPFGGNDVVNIKTFRIFARGGQLVYNEKDILPGDLSRGWDGTFDRERLTPDVFVYFAEIEFFDGRVEVVRGDVTLVR
ncbi:MAG: gliding motility-associated C-terminal domain-containing protein, partial [Bacteroidota bacterium]